MQDIFIYLDDSGHLHRNEKCGWFVYAGYIFAGAEEKENAKRQYINANKKIKAATGRSDELKAYGLDPAHKRALYTVLREYHSLAVAVNISRVRDHILDDKHSICRFKDYAIKRIVKNSVKDLIGVGTISATENTRIYLSIDEQLTATNGYYGLQGSIYEELKHGIMNHDYGVYHQPVFGGQLIVNVEYCESKSNYLVQASDILANRIWSSFRNERPEWRNIPNHTALQLP